MAAITEDMAESMEQDKEEDMEEGTEENEDSDSSDDEAETNAHIAQLEQQVSENPYLYDAHCEFVKALRAAGELERLRAARENMNSIFPLTGALWIEWIEDEQKVMEDDRQAITKLFERAVKDYTSVSVWLEYIQFSIGGMAEKDGITAVRDVCERAITAAGLNTAEGAMLWEAYREYENAILMGLQPALGSVVTPEQQEQLDAQAKRIAAIFRRQLAIPLNDMSNTMEEYKDFVSEDEVKKILPVYNKASAKLEELRPYEDRLLTEEDKLTVFEDYIDFELACGEPARIQCIFERTLNAHCLIPRLWVRYTQYLDVELRIPDIVLSVYERAIRNCPWSCDLWCGYGRAMERYKQPHENTKDVFVRALSGGFSSSQEYLSVWNAHVDYLRRRVDWTKESSDEETELWTTFDQALQHLLENFGVEGDPECTLLQYQARIKARFAKDMEAARTLWNQVMQAGHGNKAAMWLEYFNLERSYGDHKHARKILQRGLNSANDWPESIAQVYIRFEREEGDCVEVYDAALTRCEAQMVRVEERRAKAAEKEAALEAQKKQGRKERKAAKKATETETQKESTTLAGKKWNTQKGAPKPQPAAASTMQNMEGKVFVRGQSQPMENVQQEIRPYKRKAQQEEEESKAEQAADDGFKVPDKPAPPGYKGAPPGYKGASTTGDEKSTSSKAPPPGSKGPPPGFKGPPPGFKGAVKDSEEPPEKKAKVEEAVKPDTPAAAGPDPNKDSQTVFVSNLDFKATEEDIRSVLGDVGEITEIRLIKNFSGRSKGYAYVVFNDELAATAALEKDRTVVEGRPMFVSQCNQRVNNAASFKYATELEKNKLFVRGLPFSCTKTQLEEAFSEHGELKEVRLVTYRSGAPKGIAYVEYVKESDASQAVLKMDSFMMGEHQISVALSNPPQRKAPASQTYQPSLGGGKKDFGIRGRANTQLSLVPRALQRKPAEAAATADANGDSGDKAITGAKMSNADFRSMLLKQ